MGPTSWKTIILVSGLTVACNSSPSEETNKQSTKEWMREALVPREINRGTKLDSFVSSFVGTNSELFKNDVLRERHAQDFHRQLQVELTNGVLEDLPLTCLDVRNKVSMDEAKNGKPVATFSGSVAGKDVLYSLTVFVDALVDESLMAKLEIGKQYYVKGQYSLEDDKNFPYTGFMVVSNRDVHQSTVPSDYPESAGHSRLEINVHNVAASNLIVAPAN
jgi:hypothetical protein